MVSKRNSRRVASAANAASRKRAINRRASQDRSGVAELSRVAEAEKHLLAFEIHDGLIQQVVAAKLLLDAFVDEHPRLTSSLTPISDQLRAAVVEARRLIRELRPIRLEDGLSRTLEAYIDETNAQDAMLIEYTPPTSLPPLPPLVESSVFRIVQEGINNARRHGRAKKTSVSLSYQRGNLVLEVIDNGVGFDPKKVATDRFGLLGIRERANCFGGRAQIRSEPKKGTTIRVTIPIDSQRTG